MTGAAKIRRTFLVAALVVGSAFGALAACSSHDLASVPQDVVVDAAMICYEAGAPTTPNLASGTCDGKELLPASVCGYPDPCRMQNAAFVIDASVSSNPQTGVQDFVCYAVNCGNVYCQPPCGCADPGKSACTCPGDCEN